VLAEIFASCEAAEILAGVVIDHRGLTLVTVFRNNTLF
jgi:hypothetical protein